MRASSWTAIFILSAGAAPLVGCSDDAESGPGGGGAGGASPGGGTGGAAAGAAGESGGGGAAGSSAGGSGGDAVGPDGGAPLERTEATLSQGTASGFLSMGVRAFLGIPFGTTTGGDARWAAASPAGSWRGVLDASEFGPPCAQLNPTGTAFDETSSEDCLTVNVWAPRDVPTEGLPVMVWFYGGAYQFGSGAAPYNGESLVNAGNVVVVTFNYRLGALGFLAHPAITAAAATAGTPPANFGLQDQQLALAWVRDNIDAFGGDPQSVTAFGESAGANSICMHMAAPSSQGLFQRAIIESGLCEKPMLTLAEAEQNGQRYAEAMGCTDPGAVLACLGAMDMPTVLLGPASAPEGTVGGLFYQDVSQGFGFQPIVDGTLVVEQPAARFAAGNFGGVSEVLHGATTDEGALFHVPPLGGLQPTTDAEYEAALAVRFAGRAADVAAQYPPSAYASHAEALAAVTGDAVFRCPAVVMAEQLRAAGKTNYLYRFDLPVTSPFEELSGRAFHSADIPYVFGNEYLLGTVPDERAGAADATRGYWTRFASTGDPNGDGAPTWPAFDAAAGHMNLAATIEAGSDWRADGCDFWDDVAIVAF